MYSGTKLIHVYCDSIYIGSTYVAIMYTISFKFVCVSLYVLWLLDYEFLWLPLNSDTV